MRSAGMMTWSPWTSGHDILAHSLSRSPVSNSIRYAGPIGYFIRPVARQNANSSASVRRRLRGIGSPMIFALLSRSHGDVVRPYSCWSIAQLKNRLIMISSERAFCGAVRFLALMIASTSNLVISVTGRSPHAAMNTLRRSRSTALPLRSCDSLSAMKASATLANECLMRSARSRSAFSRASASTTAGSIPLAIRLRHSPAVRRASSKRDRAIGADDAAGRCGT